MRSDRFTPASEHTPFGTPSVPGETASPNQQTLSRPSRLSQGLGVTYAVLGYLAFFPSYGALVLRTMGFLDDTASDLGPRFESPWLAVAFDLALLFGFGLQHTVMARGPFKRWWTRIIPAVLERSTYVWVSNVAVALLAVLWAPVQTSQVWEVTSPIAATSLLLMGACGWAAVAAASFLIDHFELFGLRQVWCWARAVPLPQVAFRTPGAYRWVRHPMMFGFLLGLWGAPVMSMTRLTLACGMTAYILVGVYFEERDLIARFGQRYLAYKQRVSMFLPLRVLSARADEEARLSLSQAEGER